MDFYLIYYFKTFNIFVVDYEDSLNLTPRFDPDLKPVKGVLKLSPGFPEIQEKSNLFKKKKKLKRLKATRFL